MKKFKKIFAALLCMLMLVSSVCIPTVAAETTVPTGTSVWSGSFPAAKSSVFSGGTGEFYDPFILANAEDVAQLSYNVRNGETYKGKHFVLTCDLDLGKGTWQGIGGCGNNDKRFAGYFDGNYHAVYNLNLKNANYNGFFGQIGDGAVVKNIGIMSGTAEYSDVSRSAAFIGYIMGNATVENCFNRADVSFEYNSNTSASLTECRSGALIGTFMKLSSVGALTVKNCYNTGNITLTIEGDEGGYAVGGIIGESQAASAVYENCYSSGNITVNTAKTTVPNASIKGVGGIMGSSGWCVGTLTNCIYSGTISVNGTGTAKPTVGALVGEVAGASQTIDGGSYYGVSAIVGSGDKSFSPEPTLSNTPIALQTAGGSFMTAAPVFSALSTWDGSEKSEAFSGGTGTATDPYLLSSAADVALLAANVRAGTAYSGVYFRLTCDLDINGKGWVGIGGSATDGANNKRFEGIFDGNHHVVYNLALADGAFNGFFGRIGAGAKIANLGIASGDVKLTGAQRSGILVGHIQGDATIFNCFNRANAKISVADSDYQVGMLVGAAMNNNNACTLTIENCYNTGTATVTAGAGGIVFGGIVGRASSGTATNIINCHSKGDITVMTGRSTASLTADNVGGILGYNEYVNAVIKDSTFSGCISFKEDSSTAVNIGAIAGALGRAADTLTITDCKYFLAQNSIENLGYCSNSSETNVKATNVESSDSAIDLTLVNAYFMTGNKALVLGGVQQFDTDNSRIRFVSELVGDYSAYRNVGFELKMSYGGQSDTVTLKTKNVYSSLLADGERVTPEIGGCFVAYGIGGVPTSGTVEITFTPIAEVSDGVYAKGDALTVVIENGVVQK